jgi:hypothetical protein
MRFRNWSVRAGAPGVLYPLSPPELDGSEDSGDGGGVGAGASEAGAGFGAAAAFFADFFGAAFLAAFFAGLLADFFTDFLADFLAVFFADFFDDFFADFFFAVTAFFLAFLPFAFFAFLALAIVVLLLPPIFIDHAFQVFRFSAGLKPISSPLAADRLSPSREAQSCEPQGLTFRRVSLSSRSAPCIRYCLRRSCPA